MFAADIPGIDTCPCGVARLPPAPDPRRGIDMAQRPLPSDQQAAGHGQPQRSRLGPAPALHRRHRCVCLSIILYQPELRVPCKSSVFTTARL